MRPAGTSKLVHLHGAWVGDAAEKEKAVEISLNGLYLCRQRPTLPHTFACSNIGPAGLNYRVRDGNGWIPRGKITDKLRRLAGVNKPPSGGEWEPAAEVLRRILCAEGSPTAISVLDHLICNQMLQQTFKEREDETSQLNRLDGPTFFFAYFPISAVLRRQCFP